MTTTKISDAFDRLHTIIAAQLTNAKRIPNVYELERVAGQILMNGYGVAIGAGENPKRDLSQQLQMRREFAVIQTRLITATDHAASAIGSIEKTIMEEQFLLIKALENDTVLANAGSGIVSDVTYESDTGLELLATQEAAGRYYVLTSLFSCRYIESLI